MKWLKYILWILFAGVVFYYLIILGGPIRNLIELRGCTVSYTHYLTNNMYCNWRTSGSCPTNDVILTNARREVLSCLCDTADQDPPETRELLELIQADPLLSHVFERIQSEQGVLLNSVQAICSQRNTLFAPVALK
jgi:hypothetical protein